MIHWRPARERGRGEYGWLSARYTFSFAHYLDPRWGGFGRLRVLNQDRVAPGRGFGEHGHADMEIVTVVLDGLLEHRDGLGNGSRIAPGEVQRMSAGRGILHSEFNASPTAPLELLQMWVLPAVEGGEPGYEQRDFSAELARTGWVNVVAPARSLGEERGAARPSAPHAPPLAIGQDASLWIGKWGAGGHAAHPRSAGRMQWIHVARGSLELNGQPMSAGDGAGVKDEPIELRAREAADVVLWDLPAE